MARVATDRGKRGPPARPCLSVNGFRRERSSRGPRVKRYRHKSVYKKTIRIKSVTFEHFAKRATFQPLVFNWASKMLISQPAVAWVIIVRAGWSFRKAFYLELILFSAD